MLSNERENNKLLRNLPMQEILQERRRQNKQEQWRERVLDYMLPPSQLSISTSNICFGKSLVGNVSIMSHRQHPPNDMSSRHMSSCRKNVGNVCRTLEKNVVPTCQMTCRQDIIQDFADMSAKSFGHKEKKQNFAENHAVTVWFSARKSWIW